MLQIIAGRVTQKNKVETEYKTRMHVHTQKGHSSRTEVEQVGTARIEFRKASKENGIGIERNRRNQRMSRKITESDQIRNCEGRLMYRKLTKKNRKEKKITEKSKRK